MATDVTVTDSFTRADGKIGVTGGDWVANSSLRPVIASNAVTSTALALGYAVRKESNPGTQSVQMKLTAIAAGQANIGGLILAVENTVTVPGSSYNWQAGQSHYKLQINSTNYKIQKKDGTLNTYTTMTKVGGGDAQYVVVPAVGDIIKLTWDPATGLLKAYIDAVNGTTLRISVDDSAAKLSAGQTRIGFVVNDLSKLDDFVAIWGVSTVPTTSYYKFYEYTEPGGVPTETLLGVTEWDGVTEGAINAATTGESSIDTSTLPLVTDIPWADNLVEEFGVNVALRYQTGSIYSQGSAVGDRILDLAPRYVRDRYIGSVNQLAQYPRFAAAGIKVHSTVGTLALLPMTDASIDAILSAAISNPTWMSSFSNVSQPNDGTNLNWVTLVRNHQVQIKNRMTALGINLPLLGPALNPNSYTGSTIQADLSALSGTDIENYIDIADYHSYPTVRPLSGDVPLPTYDMDSLITLSKSAYGKQVIWSTEGGSKTQSLTLSPAINRILPEDVDGYYRLRQQLENHRRGVSRHFQFELLDDPDATQIGSGAHYGLIKVPADGITVPNPTAWTVKPAYGLLKTFFASCADQGGGYTRSNPYVPAALRIDITCSDPALRYIIMGFRNGTYKIAMWLDKGLFNIVNRTYVEVLPVDAIIQTPSGMDVVPVDGTVILADIYI